MCREPFYGKMAKKIAKIVQKDGLQIQRVVKSALYVQLDNRPFPIHLLFVKIVVLAKLDKIAKNVEEVRIEKVMI